MVLDVFHVVLVWSWWLIIFCCLCRWPVGHVHFFVWLTSAVGVVIFCLMIISHSKIASPAATFAACFVDIWPIIYWQIVAWQKIPVKCTMTTMTGFWFRLIYWTVWSFACSHNVYLIFPISFSWPGPPLGVRLRTRTRSPGCKAEHRNLLSYLLFALSALIVVAWCVNLYACCIAAFHLVTYSAFVSLLLSSHCSFVSKIKSIGNLGGRPNNR